MADSYNPRDRDHQEVGMVRTPQGLRFSGEQEVKTPIDGVVDNASGANAEVDLRGMHGVVVTFANNEDKDIDWELYGLLESGGDEVLLSSFTQATGADIAAETITDGWLFITVYGTAASDPVVGTATVKVAGQY